MIRGLAALAVLVTHLRHLFFVDAEGIPPLHRTAAIQALYWLSSFGHEAVIVFFVLSGFLISRSILRSWSEGKWSWRTYLIDRFSRLYVVLIPALLLGLLWDRTGICLFGAGPIYTGHAHNGILNFSIVARSKLDLLLANALFLQVVTARTFGSNGPLWSLSFEFWYYIIFALGFSAIIADNDRRRRLAYGAGAILVLLGVGQWIAAWFLIWLLGAAINLLPPLPWLRSRLSTFIALLFLAVTLEMTFRSVLFAPETLFADLFVGLAASLLIVVALQSKSPARPNVYSRVGSRLAGCSYTLYLVHLPCLVFLDALIINGARWQPEPSSFAAALALGAVTFLYALVVAGLTERRTGDIRRFVSRSIDSFLAKYAPADEVDVESGRL